MARPRPSKAKKPSPRAASAASKRPKRKLSVKPKLPQQEPEVTIDRRLGAPQRDGSKARGDGVRELTWTAFDALVHQLVWKLGRFKPDVVVGIVKGGLFVGGAVAGLLRCEFVPVRLSRRSRDHGAPSAEVRTSIPPEVKGRRVLVVDDVMLSGETLERALAEAVRAGAREVKSATLVLHRAKAKAKTADKRPDWFALETDDLVVFPWDYELRGTGPSNPSAGSDTDSEMFGA